MILIRLVALLFAALTLLMIGFAAEAVYRTRWGDAAAYSFVALLCACPAYLLFRAARRLARQTPLLSRPELSSRARTVSAVLHYTLVGGVLAFASLWLGGERGAAVVLALIYLLAAPLVLAERLEPKK